MSLSLPQNVHLLTFEPWRENSILIRFEHILAQNEDIQYANPVTFNFKDIFRDLSVEEIRETTLSANQWLSDAVRMNFSNTADITRKQKKIQNKDILLFEEVDHVVIDDVKMNVEISETQYRNVPLKQSEMRDDDDNDAFKITIKPMEIRTFIVKLEWRP